MFPLPERERERERCLPAALKWVTGLPKELGPS